MFELKYFTHAEFVAAAKFTQYDLNLKSQFEEDPFSFYDPLVLRALDEIRHLAGFPFILTCTFRSQSYERSKNRSGNSAHSNLVSKPSAFDIRCTSDSQRFRLVHSALAVGCRRIGIGSNFVHLDFSQKLSQRVIWTYYNNS